jgi:TolA-binding protein
MPGISDKAFLLIAQSYIQTGQWDLAQQALQSLLRRFPNSPWADEARFNIGLVELNAKQFDAAITSFSEVAGRSGSELSARAQLQIGLCRMEQKQFAEAAEALLIVAYAFDYPDLTASALCEAAKAMVALDKKQEATQLLERVVKDNPTTRWAELAMKRLAELK